VILARTLAVALLLAGPAAAQDQPRMEKRPGHAVDARGETVVDPTKNVLDLVEAGNRRQDDLRKAELDALRAQVADLRRFLELRDTYNEKLAAAESRRINEQLALRAVYDNALRDAEANRINAIRQVDVGAVAEQNRRATETAATLAQNVATSAEALRNLVGLTATAASSSLQQLVNPLSARITTLEQGSYTTQGKSAVSDPAFQTLLQEVRALSVARSQETGKDAGSGAVWGALGAGIGAAGVIGGLALAFNNRKAA
jgi:hypothetical protein